MATAIRYSTIFCILLLALLSTLRLHACELRNGHSVPTARIPLKFEGRRGDASYYHKLLALALHKTEPLFGPCEPQLVDIFLPNVRLNLHSVESGLVDVVGATTSQERERRLQPVRIPLLKGLMGYRLLLIRSGDQQRFDKIHTAKDLQQLVFGQGSNWPDNDVMRANGIRVVTSPDHYTLLRMLQARRFDAYPRGVQQISMEKTRLSEGEISLDAQLAIAYVSPSYFHVANHNRALAKRLEQGLRMAVKDGSFDALFYSQPMVTEALSRLSLGERRVFYLCNPNIHPDTPLAEPAYWFRPWPADVHCEKPPSFSPLGL
ncbi:MAG: hypothetical protein KTR17_01005 [Cellvibrionaceae bacterium]|nr:hypothetical protein [Cellvibrionaceae bacterium]